MKERMMVISAHTGDFVWRCGGSIAKYIDEGNEVKLVVLSDGIRGESNQYWKQEGANTEDGKKKRLAEAKEAASRLGLKDFVFFDLDDYPMPIDKDVVERLAHEIRLFRPDFIVTHDNNDAYNLDHNDVNRLVRRAYMTASASGFLDGEKTAERQCAMFGFEPHFTEASGFHPMLYVDITSSFDKKLDAMNVYATQTAMINSYIAKAELRANEVRHKGRTKDCKYAECFSMLSPVLVAGRFVY